MTRSRNALRSATDVRGHSAVISEGCESRSCKAYQVVRPTRPGYRNREMRNEAYQREPLQPSIAPPNA
jgi:hypothetical protein